MDEFDPDEFIRDLLELFESSMTPGTHDGDATRCACWACFRQRLMDLANNALMEMAEADLHQMAHDLDDDCHCPTCVQAQIIKETYMEAGELGPTEP